MIASVNLSNWNPKLLSFGNAETRKIKEKGFDYEVIPINYEREELRLKLPEMHFKFGFRVSEEFPTSPIAFLLLEQPILDIFQEIERLYNEFARSEFHSKFVKVSKNNGDMYAGCAYNKNINPLIIDFDTGNDISIDKLMNKEFWAIPVFRFIIFDMGRCHLRCEITELKVIKIDN